MGKHDRKKPRYFRILTLLQLYIIIRRVIVIDNTSEFILPTTCWYQ